MRRILSPWRDPQDEPPRGYCRKCGAELYEFDDEAYCDRCLDEMEDDK